MLYSIIKANTYQDSLRLIHLSNLLASTEGVSQVSVMMGTPMNKDILRNAGLVTDDLDKATVNDLVVFADVEDEATGDGLVSMVNEFLSREATQVQGGNRIRTVRSLDSALRALPDANVGVVSVPGEYAADEARQLLDRGINAFIFSDNVSVEDEVALKQQARDMELLVMGPDCGTGYIHGVPLGFANSVIDGNIGVVGASGTGTQEIMVQISQLHGGVSHALGLGGRDLSATVGGLSCVQALNALDADLRTDVIVLVSKPPAASVRGQILELASGLSKPVVAVLVGEHVARPNDGNLWYSETLEDAARLAVELAGTSPNRPAVLRVEQQAIKALYAGGTFASEAAFLMEEGLGLQAGSDHEDGYILRVGGHEVIDLGDDAYTRGRPHPMIEPDIRNDRVMQAIADPATAVVLLDVVLGYGSHPDPANVLAPVVSNGLARLGESGHSVSVVASICGTESDPQVLSAQRHTLQEAGVVVMHSNASAVRYAINVATRRARRAEGNAPTSGLAASLLAIPPRVINIGLREFTGGLTDAEARAVQFDWRPIAGGDPHLQQLLAALR